MNPAASSRSFSSSSSSSSSDFSSTDRNIHSTKRKIVEKHLDPKTRRGLKRSIEKKFRLRYTSLQSAYEQRLEALATRVQEAVNQMHNDVSIQFLQENELTNEFASARLGEIVHECFYGERERYVRAMSDQIAWQASDLRETQQKLRLVQRRESDFKRQWKTVECDRQALHHELNQTMQELQEVKMKEKELTTQCTVALQERDAARKEIEMLKRNVQAMEVLRQEHEALKVKMLRETTKGKAARSELEMHLKDIQEAKNRIELEKQASEHSVAHLKHLLSLAESKTREVSQAIVQLQKQDYPSKLAHLESKLVQQQQLTMVADTKHKDLQTRYEEFGQQVEQYMNEQAQEKAALLAKGEDQVKELQHQREATERLAHETLREKENELVRVMDQLKVREEALEKAELKIAGLEEQLATVKAEVKDVKVRYEEHVRGLEKDIVQWQEALENEQKNGNKLQKVLLETKNKYELQLASLHDAFAQKIQQEAEKKEIEARKAWQDEFVAEQNARIDELKEKYDQAFENQHAELLQARQLALETSKTAAAQWEKARLAQKQDDEREKQRQVEETARERQQNEELCALKEAQKRKQQEFKEREKRLKEREEAIVEKEKLYERQRQEEARNASMASSVSAKPSSVVYKVATGANDEGKKKKADLKGGLPNRESTRKALDEDEQEEGKASIPLAQHTAELEAKEAQAALRAEEQVQKRMKEFQESKELEFRAAMVNVRTSIEKFELSLDEAKAEKKQIEEQLQQERQALVHLKMEYEASSHAKRSIAQRFEEATENLGRLRNLVEELQAKCQSLEEQCKLAVAQKEESDAMSRHVQRANEDLHGQLARLTEASTRLESSFETSRETREQSEKELRDRIAVLEDHIQAREDHFQAKKSAIKDANARELNTMSAQYDSHLQKLEERIEKTQQVHLEQETKASELEESVRELSKDKESLEATIDRLKAESLTHRKEFADLARMHSNLTKTMNMREQEAAEAIEEEQRKRIAAEKQVLESEKKVEGVRNERRKGLDAARQSLQQLASQWKEFRRCIQSEMDSNWMHVQKEVSLAGLEWQKQTKELLQRADSEWKRRANEDNQALKMRLEEMKERLSSQRLSDERNYDEVRQRLETRSQELEEMKAKNNEQESLNSRLRCTVEKLEEEQKLHFIDLLRQQEALSTAQAALENERAEKDRIAALLATQRTKCDNCTKLSTEPAAMSSLDAANSDGREPSSWPSQQFSTDLSNLTTQLQETQAEAIQKAIAKASVKTDESLTASFKSELEAAKSSLQFLWSEEIPEKDDDEESLPPHLPWYLCVLKMVKREREAHETELSALRKELAAKKAEKKKLFECKLQWQEANNLLRFEKDTLLRELELLKQTLEKRKEHELEERRVEYEAQIDHLKQRQERAILKADQNYESAMNQCREMLEAERRASSYVKNELIELKMAYERTEEELKEAQQKLDKKTAELQESASKWKRKAKVAMKQHGVKAAMTMSSSSHGTEEDSDASYRLMYTQSRRVPSAMADLSSLMEQSLWSIRNESVPSPPTPRRQ